MLSARDGSISVAMEPSIGDTYVTSTAIRANRNLGRRELAKRAFTVPLRAEQQGALETNDFRLIFLEDHAIDHHIGASSHVVNANGNADFNFRSYRVFVQNSAASSHIANRLAEAILDRSATFP